MIKLKRAVLFILIFILCITVYGQQFDLSFSMDWEEAKISGQSSVNLNSAGVRLPGGRFLGEEILEDAFPALLRPHLLSIQYDSSSSIGDLLSRGELSLGDIDSISYAAERYTPSLSGDFLNLLANYSLSLNTLSNIIRPTRRFYSALPPLLPASAAEYSGIIIIANTELPVHGRLSSMFAVPCLFPKIWDTQMNLIYERDMFEAGINGNYLMLNYTSIENIFHPTPSGLLSPLSELLGSNPLRIIARGTYGIYPTDLIIDREDALLILSTENNRRLLREGRVLFVLNGEVLVQ